jgi:hypothetical protein
VSSGIVFGMILLLLGRFKSKMLAVLDSSCGEDLPLQVSSVVAAAA